MQTPLELVFRHMEPAPKVEAKVRERAARLEKFFGRIDSCHVSVEAPHQSHRSGNRYEVKVRLHLPGGDLSVDRGPGDAHTHVEPLSAVRDAFDAAERQLRKWKQQHSGRPPERAAPLQGRIAELNLEEGWGQIDATDGRLVYFHRNAVLENGFDQLAEGDAVELSVDYEGNEKGPHASMVRPIGAQRFVDRPA